MQNKLLWILMGIFSIVIGLYPLIYVIIDEHFGLLSTKPEVVLEDVLWNGAFYGHIICGGIALLIGWLQFYKAFRDKYRKVHTIIGKIYIVTGIVSGTCGLYIALFATGGIASVLGFLSLGLLWLITTTLAIKAIKNGNVLKHQKLMIYSFACCFAAVTLRIWLPILTNIIGNFNIAYPVVAWLSWIPNTIVAYWMTRRFTPQNLR